MSDGDARPRAGWLVLHFDTISYVAAVALAACGLVAVGAWRRGLEHVLIGSVATASGVALAWALLVRRAGRERARALEAYRALGPRDPGPPPAPWIGEGIWRRAEVRELASDILRGAQPEPGRLVADPALVVASAADRARAPLVEPLAGAPVPPVGDRETHAAALDGARATVLFFDHPTWPICCDRLTTLVGTDEFGVDSELLPHVAAARPLEGDPGVDEAAAAALARDRVSRPPGATYLGDEIAAFHCRGCGRLYLGSFAP